MRHYNFRPMSFSAHTISTAVTPFLSSCFGMLSFSISIILLLWDLKYYAAYLKVLISNLIIIFKFLLSNGWQIAQLLLDLTVFSLPLILSYFHMKVINGLNRFCLRDCFKTAFNSRKVLSSPFLIIFLVYVLQLD